MSKYKGRATRCSDAIGTMQSVVDALTEVANSIDNEDKASISHDFLKTANKEYEEMDTGEIRNLAEEMGSWRDNMSGTNLESTDKYQRVEECADALETQADELEGLEEPEWEGEDLQEIKETCESLSSTLENIISELESIEFPTMYG